MGNYKFRLSELIPHAWFSKLRHLGRSRNLRQNTSPHRKLHAFPIPSPKTSRSPLPLLPTSSSLPDKTPSTSRRLRRRSTAVSSGCSCRSKASSRHYYSPSLPDFSTTSGDSSVTGGTFSPDLRSDHVLLPNDKSGSWPSPCSCNSKAAAPKSPEVDLRRIITKPPAKKQSAEPRKLSGRKTASPGVRLRLSSPRVSVSGGRRIGAASRRSTAVVKASVNPRRDFKESMVEMIAENNIRASEDLEELLACYLCLNSDEYHQVIISVFKQIWIDLNSS